MHSICRDDNPAHCYTQGQCQHCMLCATLCRALQPARHKGEHTFVTSVPELEAFYALVFMRQLIVEDAFVYHMV